MKKLLVVAAAAMVALVSSAYTTVKIDRPVISFAAPSMIGKIVEVDVLDSVDVGSVNLDLVRVANIVKPVYRTDILPANTNRVSNRIRNIFIGDRDAIHLYKESEGYWRNGDYDLNSRSVGYGMYEFTLTRFDYSGTNKVVRETWLAPSTSGSDPDSINFLHYEGQTNVESNDYTKVETTILDTYIGPVTVFVKNVPAQKKMTQNICNVSYSNGLACFQPTNNLFVSMGDYLSCPAILEDEGSRTKEVRVVIEQ